MYNYLKNKLGSYYTAAEKIQIDDKTDGSLKKKQKKILKEAAAVFNFLERGASEARYTVLHIFGQVLFWAGNQGNHQNFEKSFLSYKC